MPSSKMKLVAREIGWPLTHRLMQLAGNCWVRIPLDLAKRPNTRIVNIIGLKATEKLIPLWGGQSIYIPKGADVKCNIIISLMRNKLILDLQDYGISSAEIAQALNLSQRRVEIILNNRSRWECPQKEIAVLLEKTRQTEINKQKISEGLQKGKSQKTLVTELGLPRWYIAKHTPQDLKRKYTRDI